MKRLIVSVLLAVLVAAPARADVTVSPIASPVAQPKQATICKTALTFYHFAFTGYIRLAGK